MANTAATTLLHLLFFSSYAAAFLNCKDGQKALKAECTAGAELAWTKDAGCGDRDCTKDDFGDSKTSCCGMPKPNFVKLKDNDIRVTFLSDNEGRVPKACYRADPKSKEPYVGIMADVFYKFAEDAKLNPIETELSSAAINYAPTHKWNGCVRDIELGNTDFCVGSFTVTPTRGTRVLFAPAVWEKEMYLMAKPTGSEKAGGLSLRESLYKTFDPFDWSLWLVCLIITAFTSFLYVALEYVPEDEREEKGGQTSDFDVDDDDSDGDGIPNILEVIWDSVYLSFQSFFGGGIMHDPKTDTGRMLLLGYGFFVLIMICHYTAELTVGQIPEVNKLAYTDMEHMIKQGGRLCVDSDISGLMKKLNQQYPALIEDVNMFGFKGPVAKSFAYDAGDCEAIVDEASSPKFKAAPYCGYQPIGLKIYSNLRSMPVRTSEHAEAVTHFIMNYQADGTMDAIRAKYASHNECTVDDENKVAEEKGLDPKDLSGAIFLYWLFVIVAIVGRVAWILRKKCCCTSATREQKLTEKGYQKLNKKEDPKVV